MSETVGQLIVMALAAERDERLSSGALYGKLAKALSLQHSALDKLVILLRNQDQSEYEARILGGAQAILRSEIDWTEPVIHAAVGTGGKT